MLLGPHAERAKESWHWRGRCIPSLVIHIDPPVIQTPSDLSLDVPETTVVIYRLSTLLKFTLLVFI